mmetsp:Transcript_105710/g.164952  ORF Transcript_105710/g.164952 Transcript_105710/m.164952 type:complete len:310 (-) Transcript_105710:81-1010(-)
MNAFVHSAFDEFGIGWNEIFDADPETTCVVVANLVSPVRERFVSRKSQAETAGCGPPPGEERRAYWAVAKNHETRGRRATARRSAGLTLAPSERVGDTLDVLPSPEAKVGVTIVVTPTEAASASTKEVPKLTSSSPPSPTSLPIINAKSSKPYWASEILTSRRPPDYLKFDSGRTRESAVILAGIKDNLMQHPASSPRKPAETMEKELNQWRHEISERHRAKRKEARYRRRLARRCRVKADEDLGTLETHFQHSSHLTPIEDPADRVETWTPSTPSSKTFFSGLAERMFVHEDEAKASSTPSSSVSVAT